MRIQDFKKIMRELNDIAFPLIINSIFGLIISFIDKGMVGRLSADAIGAVGAVNSIMFSLAGVMGVIAITFNIYGGRCLGEKDTERFESYFSSAIIINILLGGIIALPLLLIQEPLLSKIFGFEGTQLKSSIEYLSIMSLYPLIQTVLFSFSAFFKIIKETKHILTCSTFTTILNVILNYLLIFGNWGFPRLEVRGAALSTIIALTVNILLYTYICRRKTIFPILDLRKHQKQIILLLKESKFLVGQEILEGSVFIVGVNAILSRIGVLESYIQLIPILSVIFIAMHMYATAVLTLVSKNIASKNKVYLLNLPKIALFLVSLTGFILSIVFIFFRFEIIYLVTTQLLENSRN